MDYPHCNWCLTSGEKKGKTTPHNKGYSKARKTEFDINYGNLFKPHMHVFLFSVMADRYNIADHCSVTPFSQKSWARSAKHRSSWAFLSNGTKL